MAAVRTNGARSHDTESFAGHSRFVLELEFVQSLSSPYYLQYLAAQKYFEDPDFVRYLDYLQYFRQLEYLRYLQYPGPTLRALELVQQESFRRDILSTDLVDVMVTEGFEAATGATNR